MPSSALVVGACHVAFSDAASAGAGGRRVISTVAVKAMAMTAIAMLDRCASLNCRVFVACVSEVDISLRKVCNQDAKLNATQAAGKLSARDSQIVSMWTACPSLDSCDVALSMLTAARCVGVDA
jgi:hypothetical protein